MLSITPTPMDFSQTVQMSFNFALQGGGPGRSPPHLGGSRGAQPPRGSRYTIECIHNSIPYIKWPSFIRQCVPTPQHQHKASETSISMHLSLYTMIHVSFIIHNVTNSNLIVSPNNSAIPFYHYNSAWSLGVIIHLDRRRVQLHWVFEGPFLAF